MGEEMTAKGLENYLKEVIAAGEIVVAELSKHGWGDLHYQVDAPQQQSVREAIETWRKVVPENESR
jgi:hypothetical protein